MPREQPWAFVGIYLRWATVGPLDWDNLPTSIPEPESISTGGWERVGGYWIDSGVQGLLDEDSLNHLIETHEDHDRVTVLEVISEYTTLLPTLAVRAGFASMCFCVLTFAVLIKSLVRER